MRIAVISDVHANLAALQAVLDEIGDIDETWCLGDLVGYGPQPNECISLLRQREPHLRCVAGNHDRAALGDLAILEFNPDAGSATLWTRDSLTPVSRAYLATLPERIVADGFTLVHGSPRNPIWEYMVSTHTARDNFPCFDGQICLMGHSHIPLMFTEAAQARHMPSARKLSNGAATELGSRRLFINPGSVGQPRDGIPEASYIILDTETGRMQHRRVPYDIEETQQLMRRAGLPERLIARLSYGL